MGEIVGVIVGIETYSRAGMDISAPFRNALGVAAHLLKMGAKGPNISLLVNQTSSPDGYTGYEELRDLREKGVKISDDLRKANIIDSFAVAAEGIPQDSRLFVYWCGYGYAGAGDRILLCSDFNVGTFNDRTFNATKRFRRLGSLPEYACFSEQIFLVDVCARYTDTIEPDNIDMSGQLRAKQVAAFAIREGGYSRGGFSDVAIAWLARQQVWPEIGKVLKTLVPDLEAVKLKPFTLHFRVPFLGSVNPSPSGDGMQ